LPFQLGVNLSRQPFRPGIFVYIRIIPATAENKQQKSQENDEFSYDLHFDNFNFITTKKIVKNRIKSSKKNPEQKDLWSKVTISPEKNLSDNRAK